MAWIKVESSVSRNRKFVKAGPAASWLWVCGLAYCQEGLTDGFIPTEALDFLGVKHARRLSLQLVLAHLWDVADGGWRVHDYLGHNKPASDVRRLQDERRTAGAQGGKASGESRRAEATAKQHAEANAKQPANPAVPEISKAEQSRATERARAGSPIHTSHKSHAACGRICVPAFLHTEFVGRRNHLQADKELRDFYGEIEIDWSTGAHQHDEPGDPVVFWRAKYDERWPAHKPPSNNNRYAGWQPR